MAKIEMTWKDNMLFESKHDDGTILIDAPQNGEDSRGMRPKALMLTSLAGCSGLDIVSMLKKMRAEVADFKIEVDANLTDVDPKFYDKITIIYKFYGTDLKEKKIKKAVDMSVEKYCGVMEMFRQFAELSIEIEYNEL